MENKIFRINISVFHLNVEQILLENFLSGWQNLHFKCLSAHIAQTFTLFPWLLSLLELYRERCVCGGGGTAAFTLLWWKDLILFYFNCVCVFMFICVWIHMWVYMYVCTDVCIWMPEDNFGFLFFTVHVGPDTYTASFYQLSCFPRSKTDFNSWKFVRFVVSSD